MRGVVFFLLALLISGVASAQALTKAPLHPCDTLAGNPIDPGRVGPGVATALLRPEPAIVACLEAVKQFPNEPRFAFQLGRAYRQAAKLDEAFRWYTAAADKGYAGAINSLGVMYSAGEGVRADCNKAAEFFTRAAGLGYPAASDNLRTLGCVRQV
jgi:TPR repeat protein